MGHCRKPFSATVKSFSKILEDLESSRSQFSKSSRTFEKLLMVAENGSFATPTSEINIQCPPTFSSESGGIFRDPSLRLAIDQADILVNS